MKILTVTTALIIFSMSAATAYADKASVNALIGHTWNAKKGSTIAVVTYGHTSVKLKMNGKKHIGKLRIVGDEICTSYKTIRKGKEACFGVKKTANGYKSTTGFVLTK